MNANMYDLLENWDDIEEEMSIQSAAQKIRKAQERDVREGKRVEGHGEPVTFEPKEQVQS